MEKIFEIIDVCDEAMSVAENLMNDGRENEAGSILTDVSLLVDSIKSSLDEDLSGHALVEKAVTICSNLTYSIKRFLDLPQKRKRIFLCEIKESFGQLKLCVDWKYKYLSSDENLSNYRKMLEDSLREKLVCRRNGAYKYKVSIVVTAYNKLEYTKLAIESIYKHTDFSKGNVELITVNNGSTDGTEEYFDSLQNEKKANFKYNLIGIPGPAFFCEGEYIVGFSNDVVATPNWLEQLIACIESSHDIAMVVPTCNEDSTSLFQGVPIPYKNNTSSLDDIEKFATEYNHSDKSLWEERIALLPFVSIYRRDLCSPPFLDPSYTKLQFIDDDFSTLLRRTGWRMILAKDTFLHHFGSVTLGDQNISSNHNAFAEMREVYLDKWGVDAWESRGILNVTLIFERLIPKTQAGILWIEPKFGMDYLSVKNYYRQNHCEVKKTDAIVLDSRYLPDAKHYFDRVISADKLEQVLPELREEYDLIGMSAYLHEVLDGEAFALLERLYGLLKPGGRLIVPIKNFCSASSLNLLMVTGGNYPWGCPTVAYKGLSLGGFNNELSRHKLSDVCFRAIIHESDQTLCEEMYRGMFNLFSDVYSPNGFKTLLKVKMMWFIFQKPDVSEM